MYFLRWSSIGINSTAKIYELIYCFDCPLPATGLHVNWRWRCTNILNLSFMPWCVWRVSVYETITTGKLKVHSGPTLAGDRVFFAVSELSVNVWIYLFSRKLTYFFHSLSINGVRLVFMVEWSTCRSRIGVCNPNTSAAAHHRPVSGVLSAQQRAGWAVTEHWLLLTDAGARRPLPAVSSTEAWFCVAAEWLLSSDCPTSILYRPTRDSCFANDRPTVNATPSLSHWAKPDAECLVVVVVVRSSSRENCRRRAYNSLRSISVSSQAGPSQVRALDSGQSSL